MKETYFSTYYHSPLGYLAISSTYDKITNLDFIDNQPNPVPHIELPPILQEAVTALDTYFANPSYQFTLAVQPQGTDFQKRVWKAMQMLPAGQVITYGELAKKLDTSARAIGQACRSNPIPIIIPCHRVIGRGSLGGFCGKRRLTDIKTVLLKNEEVLL